LTFERGVDRDNLVHDSGLWTRTWLHLGS